MRICNKDMLFYCMEKSINAIAKIGTTDADETEVYYLVGTAVHWTVDCLDRRPYEVVDVLHRELFSALRCANNCLKHNITFKKAHKSVGHGYPYKYPYDYGVHFLWSALDDVDIPESMKNQRKNYKEKLEDKNVFYTLLEVKNIVSEYFKVL